MLNLIKYFNICIYALWIINSSIDIKTIELLILFFKLTCLNLLYVI